MYHGCLRLSRISVLILYGLVCTKQFVISLAIIGSWTNQRKYGEDPVLVSQMIEHTVKGIQGYPYDNPSDFGAACLKHFLGYSDPKSGKDRTPAWVFSPSFYIKK